MERNPKSLYLVVNQPVSLAGFVIRNAATEKILTGRGAVIRVRTQKAKKNSRTFPGLAQTNFRTKNL
jgi:hypothetical protein